MLARGDGNLDVGAMSVTHCLASVWPSAFAPREGEREGSYWGYTWHLR